MKYYMFNGMGSNKESTKKKINKKKLAKIVLLVFFILLIITFISIYSYNEKCRDIFDKYIFRKDVYSESLTTISLDNVSNNNVYAYDKYIVVQQQNTLKFYNKYGNQEQVLDIEISNPIFDSNGEYLCIAEKNGKKIYLISNKNILWQKDIEGNISDINVNKNGYVSIIISGTSYKTIVSVCKQNGEELFHNYLSKTNVIATEISNDNKYLALAEADFSGIVIQSTIKIISVEDAHKGVESSIVYTYTAQANDLIINIKYQGRKLWCMYDNHIDIIEDNQNEKIVDFKNEDIIFADINLNNKAMKILNKKTGAFSSKAEIQIIDSNNKNATIYSIDKTPKQIYVKDNVMAINLGVEALFINNSGWLIKRYTNPKEISKIVISDNIAGIVYKNKIEIISL